MSTTQTGIMHHIDSTGLRTEKSLAVTRVFRFDSLDSNGWYADLNDPPIFAGRDTQMFYPDHLFEFDEAESPLFPAVPTDTEADQ